MAQILLVDDHPDLREVVGELLRLHGHEVRDAETGEAALDELGHGRVLPDVAIVDDRLPGMTGVELLRRIREDPRLASVAVIVCSADDSNREAAQLAGAVDFWLKGSDHLFDSVAKLDATLKSSSSS